MRSLQRGSNSLAVVPVHTECMFATRAHHPRHQRAAVLESCPAACACSAAAAADEALTIGPRVVVAAMEEPAAEAEATTAAAPISEQQRNDLRSRLADNFQALLFHREVGQAAAQAHKQSVAHAAGLADACTQQYAPDARAAPRMLQGYRPADMPLELVEQIASLVEAKAFSHVVCASQPAEQQRRRLRLHACHVTSSCCCCGTARDRDPAAWPVSTCTHPHGCPQVRAAELGMSSRAVVAAYAQEAATLLLAEVEKRCVPLEPRGGSSGAVDASSLCLHEISGGLRSIHTTPPPASASRAGTGRDAAWGWLVPGARTRLRLQQPCCEAASRRLGRPCTSLCRRPACALTSNCRNRPASTVAAGSRMLPYVVLQGAGVAIGRGKEALWAVGAPSSGAGGSPRTCLASGSDRSLAAVLQRNLGFVEVADGRVSRLHCIISLRSAADGGSGGGVPTLEDCSSNGTFVNHRKLAKGESGAWGCQSARMLAHLRTLHATCSALCSARAAARRVSTADARPPRVTATCASCAGGGRPHQPGAECCAAGGAVFHLQGWRPPGPRAGRQRRRRQLGRQRRQQRGGVLARRGAQRQVRCCKAARGAPAAANAATACCAPALHARMHSSGCLPPPLLPQPQRVWRGQRHRAHGDQPLHDS